jgi:hypothetical protein
LYKLKRPLLGGLIYFRKSNITTQGCYVVTPGGPWRESIVEQYRIFKDGEEEEEEEKKKKKKKKKMQTMEWLPILYHITWGMK